MRTNSLVILFLFVVSLGSAGSCAAGDPTGDDTSPALTSPIVVPNPGTDLWRAVRGRAPGAPTSYTELKPTRLAGPRAMPAGTSQAKSVESSVLINPVGSEWMKFRMQRLIPGAAVVLGGVSAIILLFFLLRGRIPVEGGLSGKMLFRFGVYERALHWFLALVFLFLACSGLILLFGRSTLKPLFGADWFGVVASAAKEGHNLFGPLFLLAVLLMLARFLRENIYAKGDLTWLLRGGGMIGRKHVTGGFFNMGEKTWYWLVILIGLAISLSGLILLFPLFDQSRQLMGLSHVVHTIGAILLLAIALGHMYLGSIGSEGTLEGMKSGYVDLNWASSHHDRWAEKCVEEGAILSPEEFEIRRRGGTPPPADALVSEERG